VKVKGSLNTFLQRKVEILYKHWGFKIINVSFFEENLSTIFKCTMNIHYGMLPWLLMQGLEAPTVTQLCLFTCVL